MKRRVEQCIEAIRKLDLDSLLISNPMNITYLTGFREAEGYLLLTAGADMFYFTNFLYQEEAKRVNAWKVIVGNDNVFSLIGDSIQHLHLKAVGFEAKYLPFLEYSKIYEYISGSSCSLIETIDLVESIRAIKTPEELSLIKKSIAISREAFEYILQIHDQASTEKDLSIEVEKFLRLKGDSQIAFSPIVASGKNSAFPHYLPQEVCLDRQFFLIDLGSKYCGYCADLTRVFFWGKMPPLFRTIYDTVKRAHNRSIKIIREGIKAKDVDRCARQIVERAGWGKFFGHGLGHGVGLAVHELPFLNHKSEEVLKEGMIITIEPAIYIPGKFGIRIEDMVLVTSKGGQILSGDVNQ
ncbi:MAG: aminopeptidase P family protein [Candidatus Omnitrophota bacterium]|nr:MAG: aminopeptidase P family protein [Candidatus Omnitrophota bacterium]